MVRFSSVTNFTTMGESTFARSDCGRKCEPASMVGTNLMAIRFEISGIFSDATVLIILLQALSILLL